MCGIAGFAGFNNDKMLKRMLISIKHRGPDDEGVYVDHGNKVSIGNKRLAIIDVKTGHQPVHNENNSMWIVFNGEIYNYQELMEELMKTGHKFYTKSDTETVIHAYEEWGENCLNKFNGMWAFVIFDSKKQELFLARDRFGIKPLYYFCDSDRFIFGSEIKALLQYGMSIIPNDKIIYDYLVNGLLDHTEETFFEGIKRLMPAHYMLVKRTGIEVKKYWDVPKINRDMDFSSKNDGEYAKRFYELLKDSVRLRLISEVPIGTCLSGGIDSSSIVSVINKILSSDIETRKVIGKKQKTFSAVYRNSKVDEREYIEEVVKATGVEKNYIFPSAQTFWKEIKKIVYHQDEPFTSTSIYAQWNVMKLARKKVTVLLDGQGGDELLAGYLPYYGIFLLNLLRKKKMFPFAREFISGLDIAMSLFPQYFGRSRKRTAIKEILNKEFLARFGSEKKEEWKTSELVDVLYKDLTTYSIPQLLRYEDRNSMAFSLEARVPFLDYRIVEYVFSLPITQKIRNGWTKFVLRNAVKGVIPEKIRKRRGKIGFETPEMEWMIKLRHEIRKLFASKRFEKRKYFNQKEVLEKFNDFCDRKLGEDFSRMFWRIINFEIWLEVFFDKT